MTVIYLGVVLCSLLLLSWFLLFIVPWVDDISAFQIGMWCTVQIQHHLVVATGVHWAALFSEQRK